MKVKRNNKGAALGLVVVLCVVLILLIIAFFKLITSYVESDETRNATDAGALNVGKHSFDLHVKASSILEHEFDDVADANGHFNLTNINRVWSKAMLANANVAAMVLTNQVTAEATAHAVAEYLGAKSISDKLAKQLKNPNNFYGSFESISSGNNVRLVADKSQVAAVKDSAWQTSYVDRGEDSNIQFDPNQLPIPLPITTPVNTETIKIPGYTGIGFLSYKFYLVPMKDGQRTHLISPENFAANTKKSFEGWENPIPNAFSVHGATTVKAVTNNAAVSWVQINPQYKFDLAMPHGFIIIHLGSNSADYTYMQQGLGQSDYGYTPSVMTPSYSSPEGFKVTFIPSNVGNEYAGASTLYDVMFPKALQADQQHLKVLSTLLQRCREIQKGYTAEQLTILLKTTPVDASLNTSDYILFLKKKNIVCEPADVAYVDSGFILPIAKSDGTAKDIANEDTMTGPNQAFFSVTDPIAGTSIGPLPAVSEEHGEFSWKPGSGFLGNLGELTVTRTTSFAAAGVPPKPAKNATSN